MFFLVIFFMGLTLIGFLVILVAILESSSGRSLVANKPRPKTHDWGLPDNLDNPYYYCSRCGATHFGMPPTHKLIDNNPCKGENK